MKSGKTVILIAVVLVAALVAAGVLYKDLSRKQQEKQAAAEKAAAEEAAALEPVSEGETVPAVVPEKEEATTEAGPETAESSEEPVSETEEEPDFVPATDFTVETMEGIKVKLSDQTGQPVIVNFWASWCPPCKAELPYFQAAYEKYGDQIRFMMVDLLDGYRETNSTVQNFILETGYTFPLYADRTGDASNAYEIYSIPMTITVSKEGELLETRIGALSEETLSELISQLLEDSD